MTDTPKTDAAVIRVDVGRPGDAIFVVPDHFARAQELRIAELVSALRSYPCRGICKNTGWLTNQLCPKCSAIEKRPQHDRRTADE